MTMSRLQHLASRIATRARDLTGPGMVLPAAAGSWVMGINLGGEPVSIQGQRWLGHDEALAAGLQLPQAPSARTSISPSPYAEPGVRQMLNSVVYRSQTLDISLPLPPGSYAVCLWIMENYRSHWHSLTLTLNGLRHERPLGDLALGAWVREGPLHAEVMDGRLQLSLSTGKTDVDAHLMGLSIYRQV